MCGGREYTGQSLFFFFIQFCYEFEITLKISQNKMWSKVYEKVLDITSYQEMKIKTTVRYHLIPSRISTIKMTKNNKCRQECRKREILRNENF